MRCFSTLVKAETVESFGVKEQASVKPSMGLDLRLVGNERYFLKHNLEVQP